MMTTKTEREIVPTLDPLVLEANVKAARIRLNLRGPLAPAPAEASIDAPDEPWNADEASPADEEAHEQFEMRSDFDLSVDEDMP